MLAKVEKNAYEAFFEVFLPIISKKKYCFSAFISRKNVFLPDIINEVTKKKDYERIS
ncbi:MAG: hypothetical protein LUE99_10410 [Bacteroides sp.]|nr:hypothetical protein [Bacteroides sp.]